MFEDETLPVSTNGMIYKSFERIHFSDLKAHCGSVSPTDRWLHLHSSANKVGCLFSQFKGEVWSVLRVPLDFLGFLDRNYRYKSVATHISIDAGLALISYPGQKFVPRQE